MYEAEAFTASARKVLLRRDVWRPLIRFLGPYRRALFGAGCLAVLQTALPLSVPLVLRELLDRLVEDGEVSGALPVAGILVFIGVVYYVLKVVDARIGTSIETGIRGDVQAELFDRLQRRPVAFFKITNPGPVAAAINDDVATMTTAVRSLAGPGLTALLTTLLAIVALAVLDVLYLVAIAVIAGVLLVIAVKGERRCRPLFERLVHANADMAQRLTESLTVDGNLLTKLYGSYESERVRVEAIARRIQDSRTQIARLQAAFGGLISLGSFVAQAAAVLVGAFALERGRGSIGDLLAAALYVRMLEGPVQTLDEVRFEFLHASVALGRVRTVLEGTSPAPLAADAGIVVPGGDATPVIEVTSVSFTYPPRSEVALPTFSLTDEFEAEGELVLDDVSFTVGRGDLVALVGPSGAGKTTIAQLCACLYLPTNGEIRVNGVPVTAGSADDLRGQIAYVTQEAALLHDTVRANVAFGHDSVTERELVEACMRAGVHEFVHTLPMRYNTVVGERGLRLSGGQRQRIAIARAILKKPQLVILDEATSQLDGPTKAAVETALAETFVDAARLVIAHRASTVRRADHIVVLSQGRIVEQGTHDELAARGSHYSRLFSAEYETVAGPRDERSA